MYVNGTVIICGESNEAAQARMVAFKMFFGQYLFGSDNDRSTFKHSGKITSFWPLFHDTSLPYG